MKKQMQVGLAVMAAMISPAAFGTAPDVERMTNCQSFIDTRSEIFTFTVEGVLDTREAKGTLYGFV